MSLGTKLFGTFKDAIFGQDGVDIVGLSAG
jgi:hypothetical protein